MNPSSTSLEMNVNLKESQKKERRKVTWREPGRKVTLKKELVHGHMYYEGEKGKVGQNASVEEELAQKKRKKGENNTKDA